MAFIMLIFAAMSCKKTSETNDLPITGSNDITSLTDQAQADFLGTTITGGTETEEFALVNDGLPDTYCMDGSSMDESSAANPANDHGKNFRGALHKLNLTDDQKAQIKTALAAFTDCRKASVERYRMALKELMTRYESKRKELMTSMKDGSITKDEFMAKMKEMKSAMMTELRALKEKEGSVMKGCYKEFLETLKTILGDQTPLFVRNFKHG